MSDVKDLAREIAAERHLLDGSLEAGELDPPEDAEQATKYARWLRGAMRERDRTLAPFDDEIEQLQAARDDLAAGYARRIGQLEQLLTGWHQAVLHDEPGRKTIKLPYVTLSARESSGKFAVKDKAAFEAWVQANLPKGLVTVRALRPVSELRPLLTQTDDGGFVTSEGEAVPGVRAEFPGVRYADGVSYTVKPT